MISNTLGIGIQGIQDGMQGMENAARRIARGGVDGPQGTANRRRNPGNASGYYCLNPLRASESCSGPLDSTASLLT